MASAISIHNTVNGRPTTALLLGSGELGKEVAIELIRLGIKVIACDRYDNAPAMQVAQDKAVINMKDHDELSALILQGAHFLNAGYLEELAALLHLEPSLKRTLDTEILNRDKA